MKLKLLLTICLLLITSQVFAKKITVYDCPTEADARSCNNCKKSGYMNIKVNVNTNKILLQYPESNTNTYLQTVKHENSRIRQVTGELALYTQKETLDVFDEDNWEYLYVSNKFYSSSSEIHTMMEVEKSMVNGKYYMSLNPTIYRCGK